MADEMNWGRDEKQYNAQPQPNSVQQQQRSDPANKKNEYIFIYIFIMSVDIWPRMCCSVHLLELPTNLWL